MSSEDKAKVYYMTVRVTLHSLISALRKNAAFRNTIKLNLAKDISVLLPTLTSGRKDSLCPNFFQVSHCLQAGILSKQEVTNQKWIDRLIYHQQQQHSLAQLANKVHSPRCSKTARLSRHYLDVICKCTPKCLFQDTSDRRPPKTSQTSNG